MIHHSVRYLGIALCSVVIASAAWPACADTTDGHAASSTQQDQSFSCRLKQFLGGLGNVRFAADGQGTVTGSQLWSDDTASGKSSGSTDKPPETMSDTPKCALPDQPMALKDLSASSTGVGATISYSNDGVAHTNSIDFKGAVGYMFSFRQGAAVIDPYARIDLESQASTVKTSSGGLPTPTYSQNNYEFGAVLRVIFPAPGAGATSFGDKFVAISATPFYEKDLLRKSELYGAGIRLTPYWNGQNHSFFEHKGDGQDAASQYDFPVSFGVNKFSSDGTSNQLAPGQLQVALLANAIFDSAHFTLPGTPLAAPVGPPKPGQLVGNYYPNTDYARLGGTLGASVRFMPAGLFQSLLGKQNVTFTYYFSDYAPMSGYRGNFAHTTGQFSVPVTSSVSIAVTYVNGRTENIAAPENKLTIGLKIGSSGKSSQSQN